MWCKTNEHFLITQLLNQLVNRPLPRAKIRQKIVFFSPCSFSWNRALCLIRSIKTKHVHEENMIFHMPWRARLNKSIRQTHSGERGGLVTALAHRLLAHFWFIASCGNFTVQTTSIRTDAAKILDQKGQISHTQMSILFAQVENLSNQQSNKAAIFFCSSLRIIRTIKWLLLWWSKINAN